jgi:hypothetical protein
MSLEQKWGSLAPSVKIAKSISISLPATVKDKDPDMGSLIKEVLKKLGVKDIKVSESFDEGTGHHVFTVE